MTKIEIEIHEDVISVLNKLKNINDIGIELIVPEGAVLFENILNIKLLKSWSDKENKVITFETDDVRGRNILMTLEENEVRSEEMMENEEVKEIDYQEGPKPKRKFFLPKFGRGKKLGGATLIGKKKNVIIAFAVFVILIFGLFFLYKYVSELPVANIKIVVNSQPLTRSIQVRVQNGAETDADLKILKGQAVAASVEDTLTEPTSGEKLIGEKAEGTVLIYNNTDNDKKFKKGTVLIYKNDDKEFKYELKDDVEVEARKELAPDPENPEIIAYKKGSDSVDVIAGDIGDKYNIDDGEKLEIEDEKKSEFEAEVSKDIEGGIEEKVKTVSQEDIDNLKAKLAENAEEKATRALEANISKTQKLIKGSNSVVVAKEAFSNVLEEETDELTLDQTFTAKGLVYEPTELDKLVDKIVESFIPEGFVLSSKERVVNVEVLGNTENTVLSDTQADIQVTLKTYVVTDISEESIKNDLMGKSVSDAQRYLGSIRNVTTYEINIRPRIPFFDNVPKDENRVKVVLERE